MPKAVKETTKENQAEPERVIISEDSMKHCMPPQFPQAMRSKKKASQQAGILEVLRQVKVNIPLLDIIKQVPAYAKFLKDLCTIKKGLGIEKKEFLTKQVSAIIQSKNPVKYKNPGSPKNFSQYWWDLHRQSTTRFRGQCKPTAILSV